MAFLSCHHKHRILKKKEVENVKEEIFRPDQQANGAGETMNFVLCFSVYTYHTHTLLHKSRHRISVVCGSLGENQCSTEKNTQWN